jgi:hypothetical protein
MLLSVSNNLSAQEKYEKESRIKPIDVPSSALRFTDALYLPTSIKWYREEGLDKESVEAKFTLNKIKCSVEFDTLGRIEDVEIEVNWEDLESNVKDSIFAQLTHDCANPKIVKVQRQFLGNEDQLLELLKTREIFSVLHTNYEFIVRCKKAESVDLFEYVFNAKGHLLSASKIVFKNSSHLEY